MRGLAILFAVLSTASVALAGPTSIFLSETFSHALVKGEKIVVPFAMDGSQWRIEGGKTLKIEYRNLWHDVGVMTSQTKTIDWRGRPVHFTRFDLDTDDPGLRLRFVGQGGWIERVRLEMVAPEVQNAPLYYLFHSVSEDDPLDDEGGFITDPKQIALIKKWVADGLPVNKEAWAIVGMHDCAEHEDGESCGMVGAYLSVAIVKHTVDELKAMGKFDDLWVGNIGDLYGEGLDVEILCQDQDLEF